MMLTSFQLFRKLRMLGRPGSEYLDLINHPRSTGVNTMTVTDTIETLILSSELSESSHSIPWISVMTFLCFWS